MKNLLIIISFFLNYSSAYSQNSYDLDSTIKALTKTQTLYKKQLKNIIQKRKETKLYERLDSSTSDILIIIEEIEITGKNYRLAELYYRNERGIDSLLKSNKYPDLYLVDNKITTDYNYRTKKYHKRNVFPAKGRFPQKIEYLIYGNGFFRCNNIISHFDTLTKISNLKPTAIWYQGCVRSPQVTKYYNQLKKQQLKPNMIRLTTIIFIKRKSVKHYFQTPIKSTPKIVSIYIGI